MSPDLLLSAPDTGTAISAGETAAFWTLGAIAVIAAVGVVLSRKAVHSALMLAVVMIVLAVFYGIQQAPFLMVVQIVVYTGAVLMLFLFVLMLVGVSSSDSIAETIKGQRVLGAVAAVCFLGALSYGLTRVIVGSPENLDAGTAAAGGNVPWIAAEVIYRYIIAFEATGALLIVAVIGALVLAHTERLHRRTQKDMSKERIRGSHPTPLPGPGTYARHNAIDTPALLPDGSVADLSLNPILEAREGRRDVAAPPRQGRGIAGPNGEPEPDADDEDGADTGSAERGDS